MPRESQRARAAPAHIGKNPPCLRRSNGSGQKGGCGPTGYPAEVELTQTTGTEQQGQTEKEPGGLCGLGRQRQGEKGGWDQQWKVIEE